MRQAPLCSQPKLQKGRGPCCCCGHSTVPSPPVWCSCTMLFASPPFTGGPLRQAPLCSQPKLQKGWGSCCCCVHSAVPSPPVWCPCAMLFASPSFTGGRFWQAPLSSQPKLQKGRGPSCCCGHSTVMYRRRRCGAARTVSHDNDDYRFRTAVQMSSPIFFCTNQPYAICLTVPPTASAFTSFFFRSRKPCPPNSALSVYRSLK